MEKNVFYSILKRIIPKLSVLEKRIPWNEFEDFLTGCKVSLNSQINSPYNIQKTEIGDHSYIDRNSFVSNTTIGKYCSIGPNFFCGWGIHPTSGISTSPMFYSTHSQVGLTYSKENKIDERKQITIGNDVFIGANVTILDGVNIGDGAVIGAGAVVSKDIPPYAIAVGCPIKVVKFRFTEEQIEALLKIRWWNFSEEQLQDVEKMFFDIEAFIQKYDK